jgi:hypothetical protein
MPKLTPLEILQTPMEVNNANAETLWQYLVALQKAVFANRRSIHTPFGKPHWSKEELVYTLVLHNHVSGTINDDGYVEEYNHIEFVALLESLFDHLFTADISTLQQIPEPKDYALLQLEGANIPYIADHLGDLKGKEEAEKWLETNKANHPNENWIMVKVK